MAASNILFKIDLKYILGQMQRIRMIDFVHPNRLRIMIDSYINRPPQCHFYTHTCPAATGKAIYNQTAHGLTSRKSFMLICPAGAKFIHNTSRFFDAIWE
jgi:hypothetical protein